MTNPGAEPAVLILPGLTPADASAARQHVAQIAKGHVSARMLSDMHLVVSELITNAFEHGLREPIMVTVHAGRTPWLKVASQSSIGRRLPPTDDWHAPHSTRISGRGLGIVRRLRERVNVVRVGEHLSITVHMKTWN